MDTTQPTLLLPRSSNQARGLAPVLPGVCARSAADRPATLATLERFHADSVGCGVSALAHGANAPTVLRREAARLGAGSGEPRRHLLRIAAAVRRGEGRGGQCLGRSGMGFQRHELRVRRREGANGREFGHNDFYRSRSRRPVKPDSMEMPRSG